MLSLPQPALNYFQHILDTREVDGDSVPCVCEPEPEGLWLHSEESIDVEKVASLIEETLVKFDLPNVVWFEWADSCDKPRLDEFSGGGVRITRGGSEWFTPYQMMREKYPSSS